MSFPASASSNAGRVDARRCIRSAGVGGSFRVACGRFDTDRDARLTSGGGDAEVLRGGANRWLLPHIASLATSVARIANILGFESQVWLPGHEATLYTVMRSMSGPVLRRRESEKKMLIDIHTHAGQGARGIAALESMLPGGVDVAVCAVISDRPAIRRNAQGRSEQYRTPDAGEYLAATDKGLRAYERSGIRLVREAADVEARTPGVVLAIEGCDFVEGDLDRFDAMEARGVRSIQLVHYVVNEMGDIQTAAAVHGGLTPVGQAAVRRMNELGIIVDVTHCTEATVRGVAAAANRPFICSHSNLITGDLLGKDYCRYISEAYARMVAQSGGVVGAWLASKLKPDPLPGLIAHMFRLIDTIGVDHVTIGTDMPAGGCAGVMEDFSRHRHLRAALVDRGMRADEVDKVCGGNWLRVFRAVRGAV